MKVYPDVRKSYFSASGALKDNGFEPVGKGIMRSGKMVDLYKKTEKFIAIWEWNILIVRFIKLI